jgi:SAM-dependent methyltransferase
MIEFRHTTDTQAIYDEIYKGELIHQMDSYFKWVCSLVKIKSGMRLLDIATGRGQMVSTADSYGALSVGIDFSMTACKVAIGNAKRISCADAMWLPFPNGYFDIVTNIGSLEHFEDLDRGILEMVRVLKLDGQAFLMVPNTYGLRWAVFHAWKTGRISDDGQPLQRYGTRSQWADLLQKNGLEVIKVLGYEHERAFPRTWHDFWRYIKNPRRLISMLFITPLIPVNAASQFVFICKPRM